MKYDLLIFLLLLPFFLLLVLTAWFGGTLLSIKNALSPTDPEKDPWL